MPCSTRGCDSEETVLCSRCKKTPHPNHCAKCVQPPNPPFVCFDCQSANVLDRFVNQETTWFHPNDIARAKAELEALRAAMRPPAKAYALRHPIEKNLWFVCYGDPGGDGEWSGDKSGRHEWWDGKPGSAREAAREMKKRLGFGDLIRVRI